jgi:glycosyltransferase involved in cell wall biosynthesis
MGERVAIVIPAYNEERTIVGVIRGLKARGFTLVIVVDDGSGDRTAELAASEGVVLVRHLFNRGLGGALGTGLQAACRYRPQIIVTFDADGQHDPDDIPRLIEPIVRGEADVAIGNRMVGSDGMPWSRRIANRIASVVTYVLFGTWARDSQSGLRAFSLDAAGRIGIMTTRMEVSSEILGEITRKRLRWKEVPVRPIYTDYSLSKGQSLRVGLQTVAKLILTKMRRLRA